MEYATLEREIHIEAAPEVVFDVVSSPEHVREWWPDSADYPLAPGGSGQIVFDQATDDPKAVAITVVTVDRPRLFSFRWTHPVGEPAATANSLLVTFELVPAGSGTTLKLTETGFREQGWEAAVLEETYRDHELGWDHHLARISPYVEKLVAR
ncbi:SRPBCC domain-containing protein [Kribbella sp. NPDC051770]|uniref:SRPBCC domain-containing protein n=1 Tax=Kribbella sp. NPDC051770 TaxID=3155413 RepID=UPI00343FB695